MAHMFPWLLASSLNSAKVAIEVVLRRLMRALAPPRMNIVNYPAGFGR